MHHPLLGGCMQISYSQHWSRFASLTSDPVLQVGWEDGSRCKDQAGLEGKARPPPSVELDPARVLQFYIPYIIEDRENQKKVACSA